MKLKKLFIWLTVVGLVVYMTSFAISAIEKNQKDEIYKQIELFSYALSAVKSEYVTEPEIKDLIYGALKGMLGALDAHSQFMDPDTYNELRVETEGTFGGQQAF